MQPWHLILILTIAGTVLGSDRLPVEGARVALDDGLETVSTDELGRFEIRGTPPAILRVEHSDFSPLRIEIATLPALELEIDLGARRQVLREEIAVSASRSQGSFSPQSASTSVVMPAASPGSPNAVAELVAESPGVSQNGQGGLFQSYSVRGVSRQRLLTLIEGARIVSERRAGVSASFVDPLLLESVEIVRGPASTYWGSGALGGVVQLFTRAFRGPTVTSGYSSAGSERFVRAGSGAESESSSWSLGVAVRHAGDARTPGDDLLPSGFEQSSAVLRRAWEGEKTGYELLILGARGRDIGKASTDYPDRIADYPLERHGLLRLSARRDSGWRFDVFTHPNELETRVERPGRDVSEVTNRAFDWGVDLQRELRLAKGRTARWGVDLFAREDVRSREVRRDPAGRVLGQQQTLNGASEREVGVYGAFEATLSGEARSGVTVLAGGRLALQNQRNGASASVDDSAVTAFLGAVVPLTGGFVMTGNLGTGLRFPSISERFFTGTTGRGSVIGNPDLVAEEATSLDLGLRWTGTTAFFAASVFRNEIDDYIERIEVEPGRLTFENLASGRIQGLEVEGAWQATRSWSWSVGGHRMSARDAAGRPLADVPAASLFAAGNFDREPWSWKARWEHRFEKTDAGSGEKQLPDADLLSASVAWRSGSDWALRFSARNLLDEEYFNSADEKVPFSPGRSLGLSLEWSPRG